MVVMLMLAAVAMQLIRAEAHSFSLWKLWSPFLLLALPTMLLTASVAVLFETLPVLRGGVGNVIYFFPVDGSALGLGATGFDDPTGLQLLYRSSPQSVCRRSIQSTPRTFISASPSAAQRAVRTFLWNGIDWTVQRAADAPALDRGSRRHCARWLPSSFTASIPRAPGASECASCTRNDVDGVSCRRSPCPAAVPVPIAAAHLTPLRSRTSTNSRFLQLVDVRTPPDAQRPALVVVCRSPPDCSSANSFLPNPTFAPDSSLAAWIWPILLWSQMGCREARSRHRVPCCSPPSAAFPASFPLSGRQACSSRC